MGRRHLKPEKILESALHISCVLGDLFGFPI